MYLIQKCFVYFFSVCLSVSTVTYPVCDTSSYLAPNTQIPEAIFLKAKSISKDVLGLRSFLRAKEFEFIDFDVVQKENELFGATLKFRFLTEVGEKTFFAKLPHSDEEIELTVHASRTGVTPYSGKISHAVVVDDLKDAITLDKMMESKEWREFFFDNEMLLLQKIGEAYGVLNKRGGILHGNVNLKNILITKDKRVYLHDFSTLNIEGKFSRPLPKDSEENDLEALFNVMADLVQKYRQPLYLSEIRKQGAPIEARIGLYKKWIREGFKEADFKINEIDQQDEILKDLRLRFSRTNTPIKVLLNLDQQTHISTWWERNWKGVSQGDWARQALLEGLIEYYFFIPAPEVEVKSHIRLWTVKQGWLGRKVVELEFEELKEAKDMLIGAETAVTVDACSFSLKRSKKAIFFTQPKRFKIPSKQLFDFIKRQRFKLTSPLYFAKSPDLIHLKADAEYQEKITDFLKRTFYKLTRWKNRSSRSSKDTPATGSIPETKFSMADTIAPTPTRQSL